MKWISYRFINGKASLCGCLVGLCFFFAFSANGQEFYRRSLAMPESSSIAPVPDPHYNLRLGPIDFSIGLGVTATYNDNIRLAPSDRKESDMIISPFLNLDSVWRLTELNTLKFTIGLQYDKYLDHSDLDTGGVLLTPSSALVFRFYIGDFRVTLSDSFSYQEDTYDFAPLTDENGKFKRWENQIGMQIDWDLNAVIMTAGYTHYNLWTVGDEDDFESQDRSVETVYLRPTTQITQNIIGGINASASWVTFDRDMQGDGVNYQVGPFLDIDLTKYTRTHLEVGYQFGDYDAGRSIDAASYSSVYVRAEISNQLSEAFTHRLSFSRSVEIGFGSAYYDLTRIEYGIGWDIFEGARLSPYAFWERYEESGGLDSGDRYGVGISLGYKLTQRVSAVLAYRFLAKDGDAGYEDYTQNLFSLTLAYTF